MCSFGSSAVPLVHQLGSWRGDSICKICFKVKDSYKPEFNHLLYCATLKVNLLLESGDLEMLGQAVMRAPSLFPCQVQEFLLVNPEQVPALPGEKACSSGTSVMVSRSLVPNDGMEVHAVTLVSEGYLLKNGDYFYLKA